MEKVFFEFAELICNRVTVNTIDAGPTPAFTIQLMVFPSRPGDRDGPAQALPLVHVTENQFPELLRAIQFAMERYFPGATADSASAPGFGGTSPADLN